MARKKYRRTKRSSEEMRTARLQLIKKRYRELILQPRELIAADLDAEFSGLTEADEFELSEAAELDPA